jgi:hypothetical protein
LCTLRCFTLQHKGLAAPPARQWQHLHIIRGTVHHQFLEVYLAIPVTVVPQWLHIPFPVELARGRPTLMEPARRKTPHQFRAENGVARTDGVTRSAGNLPRAARRLAVTRQGLAQAGPDMLASRVAKPGQQWADLGQDIREFAFAEGDAPPPHRIGSGPGQAGV